MTFVAITSGVPAQFISVRAKNTPSAWRSSCCASVHPFRAGNALMTATIPVEQAVHPRACGERASWASLRMSVAGSSPCVRGTLAMDRARVMPGRFIPVRAGNASHAMPQPQACAVHPRACGERRSSRLSSASLSGSSPCVRGTQSLRQLLPGCRRFIPVRAGNALDAFRIDAGKPVHPRACGERGEVGGAHDRTTGSSPCVRGTLRVLHPLPSPLRFIPVRAGNARPSTAPTVGSSVHPRACGERTAVNGTNGWQFGSSPCVRGTPFPVRLPSNGNRFIPVRAGNALALPLKGPMQSVHPRACGERRVGSSVGAVTAGSSPCVRGTLEPRAFCICIGRFIPVRAGNASAPHWIRPHEPVHPRACGERTWASWLVSRQSGSSPCVRGTRLGSLVWTMGSRFIPVRAGNACRNRSARTAPAVHPRACGERDMDAKGRRRVGGSSP